ncbi:rab GTPase-binding effector protein 1-like [Tubulanus polymorphus]|uniref:rab GTPase-binding effector protein 1-like n=1 Tax=Tubulanus polymorphus TaxID=672921 RepID=UPI003DA4F196
MDNMNDDGFGPLTSAEGNSDVSTLQQRVAELEQREKQLLQEKHNCEEEFGQKRAKFKELFLQKENELMKEKNAVSAAQVEIEQLQLKVNRLQTEVDDIKTATVLSESCRQNELDELQRQYQEELASLQHIMKESIAEAERSTAQNYEEDRHRQLKNNEILEQELLDLRAKLHQEREGLFASVAKSLKTKVGAGIVGLSQESENLEESMRKAQENAEILRSVVEPLEEEISVLKQKLRESTSRVDELEAQKATHLPTLVVNANASNTAPELLLDSEGNVDDKLKELNHYLAAEKASRSDLEMYVAVLNTQRNVLQDESDKLRSELHEVCRLLEQEKKEHTELKRTWQMANDQFLEAQRLLMKDMCRMESVLSQEQQRQVAEMQRKDQENEAQQVLDQQAEAADTENFLAAIGSGTSVTRKSPSKMSPGTDAQPISIQELLDVNLISKADSKTSLTSLKSDENFGLTDNFNAGLKKSWSGSQLSSLADGKDVSFDTQSLCDMKDSRLSPEKVVVTLTEAQQKAITDPTPEAQAHESLLASVKARPNDISLVGKRLVSEREWQMLQYEMRSAREKLGRPCSMCSNYETQLQNLQHKYQDEHEKVQTLERQLTQERKAIENQRKYRDELETSLKNAAEDAQAQICSLTSKLYDSEKFVIEVNQQYEQSQKELQEQLKTVSFNREQIHKELTRLQEENDSLIGRHSKNAQAMQTENIDLPNNLEEMQLLLLRYREDIISAKVAKEHIEDTLKSEIMFLKHQVVADTEEKTRIEEALTQEINQLQEQVAIDQSLKSELERETTGRSEAEGKLRELEMQLKGTQAKSKQLINALQHQVEEQSNARTKLEGEVHKFKAKISSLQVDMDNSEAVQRDFVKLSQSLQIQLEKIRQAETEVRWQHEEDIDDCNNCKQIFSVTKRKHHCRHCGRIFCADCITKTVPSGPNARGAKVCDVCHTILVKDATPYFSTEPPATPD